MLDDCASAVADPFLVGEHADAAGLAGAAGLSAVAASYAAVAEFDGVAVFGVVDDVDRVLGLP